MMQVSSWQYNFQTSYSMLVVKNTTPPPPTPQCSGKGVEGGHVTCGPRMVIQVPTCPDIEFVKKSLHRQGS